MVGIAHMFLVIPMALIVPLALSLPMAQKNVNVLIERWWLL